MRQCLTILLFGVFCGCETIVELDIPSDYQAKLVVESQFSPDSLWTFRVGKSVPYTETVEPSELIVPDARIIISDENHFRDTLQHVGGGIYKTLQGHRPVSGTTYNVKASASGFSEVQASSWAPPLQSELLEIESMEVENSSDRERYVLRFSIADQPGSNYYNLNLYQVMPFCEDDNGWFRIEDGPDYTTRYKPIFFGSNSPSFHAFIETVDDPIYPRIENKFSGAFLSDQLFEATTQEFEITFEPTAFEFVSPYFKLELSALSDDLFAFERSLELHDYYLFGPDLARSSPAVVYTNVVNGLGIFAGYTSDTYRFDAKGNEWQEDLVVVGPSNPQPCQ